MVAPRKREEELARPRYRKGYGTTAVVTKAERLPTTIPAADPDWHPSVRQVYEATQLSGQAAFYQSSDWALLYSVCEDLSNWKLSKGRPSGQMYASLMGVLTGFMLTEGERRKARIELSDPQTEAEQEGRVTAIGAYKARLMSPAERAAKELARKA